MIILTFYIVMINSEKLLEYDSIKYIFNIHGFNGTVMSLSLAFLKHVSHASSILPNFLNFILHKIENTKKRITFRHN